MQEQLITFTTAKLAKDKGFDWDVNLGYENISNLFIENNNLYNPYDKEDVIKINNDYFTISHTWTETKGSYPAPTQSLLQKWLREVHGISVLIDLDITLSYTYHINSLHPEASYVGKYIQSVHVYSTYEEALEAGLQTALNLIK